ncbi:MAG TPA: hypothetical protein VFI47_05620 [Acidimicrobiales bacterium]|nr:hypothetical protein [Acidimicrobiales bacterium]
MLGRPTGTRGRWGVAAVLAVVGVVAVTLISATTGLLDLPDWFKGGRSDPAPRGQVIYEGQRARAASERFLIDVGDGEAVVSVKAKQDHDKSGWLIDGDFQSTNGTSSVADPDDRDLPATLRVAVDYCASGTITTIEPEGGDTDRAVRFEVGELFVCDTTLEHTPGNDAAFRQDDTPTEFHGRFVSFVAGAAETAAAAAACPTDELDEFRTPEFTAHVRTQLAARFDLPESAVEVVPGVVGESDDETRDTLRSRLSSYVERRDPDHPDRRYEALSIQYLSGDGSAVDDACYRDAGATDLDELGDVPAPDPDDA